jgi:cellulose synthase/poly-beta-1,6-N-acetylglucosamine synthase-like glycosyltransferase
MVVYIFWAAIGILIYIYLGYPLLVFLLGGICRREVRKSDQCPHVSIVIAAFNEETHIRQTVENKLRLEYPEDRLEILVVSDGSTDGTDSIVRNFDSRRIRLFRQEPRQGKTAALNMAVQEAKGDIVVFSDANSIYSTDALKNLVANFSDDSVGYVTGKLIYGRPGGSKIGDGCTKYMRYENLLREYETRIGSIVGVNGGIDAVRKTLYEPMNPEQIPDFILPLKVVEKGFRVVYDPDAVLMEDALKGSSDEYSMRVRVALRALNAIKDMYHLMNPFRYRFFAWQFFSHKTLRYLAFLFLVIAYASNLVLLKREGIYLAAFVAQTLLYLFALAGWFTEMAKKESGMFYLPFYFCLLNVASAEAFVKMLQGRRQVIWNPRKG